VLLALAYSICPTMWQRAALSAVAPCLTGIVPPRMQKPDASASGKGSDADTAEVLWKADAPIALSGRNYRCRNTKSV
jgi:hypothetical protein